MKLSSDRVHGNNESAIKVGRAATADYITRGACCESIRFGKVEISGTAALKVGGKRLSKKAEGHPAEWGGRDTGAEFRKVHMGVSEKTGHSSLGGSIYA